MIFKTILSIQQNEKEKKRKHSHLQDRHKKSLKSGGSILGVI
jgi:hypothetical protein